MLPSSVQNYQALAEVASFLSLLVSFSSISCVKVRETAQVMSWHSEAPVGKNHFWSENVPFPPLALTPKQLEYLPTSKLVVLSDRVVERQMDKGGRALTNA